MALQYGVPRAAKRRGLNAYGLCKRVNDAADQEPAAEAAPEFVELAAMPAEPAPAPLAAGIHECVVELHNARGAKMRAEVNAGSLAGFASCAAGWMAHGR